MFDDEERGLQGEPFVLRSSEMLERIVEEKLGKETSRIQLAFSDTSIPSADLKLRRVWNGIAHKRQGCAYNDGVEEFWLCPEITTYFGTDIAPEEIYLTIRDQAA